MIVPQGKEIVSLTHEDCDMQYPDFFELEYNRAVCTYSVELCTSEQDGGEPQECASRMVRIVHNRFRVLPSDSEYGVSVDMPG